MRQRVPNLLHDISGAWLCLEKCDVDEQNPWNKHLEQQRLARAMRQNVSNLLHLVSGAWMCLGELDVEDEPNPWDKYT